jgi:methionyl-tRNA synthetase
MDSKENILITSALPYVNNVPHLGNIIGCVLSADVWARYKKSTNNNILYICGTDEYGTATETKARQENLTEKEICDKYHEIHKKVYQWFNIDFDYFGRTTTENQTKIAQEIFMKIVENDLLIEKKSQQYFCPALNTFLADRYISGKCPYCGASDANGDQCDNCGKLLDPIQLINPFCKSNPELEIVLKETEHLYIDLPKIEKELKQWFDQNKEGWSKNAISNTQAWFDKGLEPRCITRDLKWGTPVPNTEKFGDKYKDKVFYVWFDAPIGYISITSNFTDEWEKWWKNSLDFPVEYVQFMAKDNIPFHSIIFPATLIASQDNYKQVDRLASVEYLNYEDRKFSKSKGTGVFGDTIQELDIDSDAWRFYLLYIRPEGADSHFIWDDFLERNNNELVNNLGNLMNRILTFTFKKFKKVPKLNNLSEIDNEFINQTNLMTNEYLDLMDDIKLRDGIKHLMLLAKLGNRFMQNRAPWVLFKENKEECENVLHILIHFLRHLTCLLSPFLPNFTIEIEKILGQECKVIKKELELNTFSEATLIKPKILFKKITEEQLEEFKGRFN